MRPVQDQRESGDLEFVRTLIEGVPVTDATVFFESGLWWLFCTHPRFGGAARLSRRDAAWRVDGACLNPVKPDVSSSRPAGTALPPARGPLSAGPGLLDHLRRRRRHQPDPGAGAGPIPGRGRMPDRAGDTRGISGRLSHAQCPGRRVRRGWQENGHRLVLVLQRLGLRRALARPAQAPARRAGVIVRKVTGAARLSRQAALLIGVGRCLGGSRVTSGARSARSGSARACSRGSARRGRQARSTHHSSKPRAVNASRIIRGSRPLPGWISTIQVCAVGRTSICPGNSANSAPSMSSLTTVASGRRLSSRRAGRTVPPFGNDPAATPRREAHLAVLGADRAFLDPAHADRSAPG